MAINYLLQKDEWGLNIEDFFIRMLPANTSHEEYKKRTVYFYKITGVPLNTNIFDLKPLLTYLKGRTCTFTQTNRSSVTKNTYIYVHPDDFKAQGCTRFCTTFTQNKKLFVYPSTDMAVKTCRVCGDHSHVMDKCPSPDFHKDKNDRIIFRQNFIQRNTTKITSDEKTRSTFNHVIQLNSHRSSDKLSQSSTTHRNNYQGAGSFLSRHLSHSPHSPNVPANTSRYHSSSSNNRTVTISSSNSVLTDKLQREVSQLRAELNTMAKTVLNLSTKHELNFQSIQVLENKVSLIETQFSKFDAKQDTIEKATFDNSEKLDLIISRLTMSSSIDPAVSTNSDQYYHPTSRPAPYTQIPYQQFKSDMAMNSHSDSPNDFYQDSYTDNDDISESNTIQEIISPDPNAPPAKSLFGNLMSWNNH